MHICHVQCRRTRVGVDRCVAVVGMYSTPEEAALAYNKKSRELFGENGKINVIKQRSRVRNS